MTLRKVRKLENYYPQNPKFHLKTAMINQHTRMTNVTMQLGDQLDGKINIVNPPMHPIMKSHKPERCLDVLATEGIVEGCWLEFGTWYFNNNEHESMRAETLRIYLLKYLHHSQLNWIMMNPDIQALISQRILLKNKI
jgi:hypothetical protein